MSTARASLADSRARLWFPHQHGAWAMLAVPLLLGVIAGGPNPWQGVLAVAAVSGYLIVATLQSWAQARFRRDHVASLALYGSIAGVSSVALVARYPQLLLAAAIVVPAAALTIEAGRARKPRHLTESLLQSAQAVVLAPAAAWIGGVTSSSALLAITVLAGLYLVSSVLAVRSAIRERGNPRFAAGSVAFNLAAVPVTLSVLGAPYALLALGLAIRAAVVPIAQVRLAGTRHPVRPIQLGLIEALVSVAFVVLALIVPPH